MYWYCLLLLTSPIILSVNSKDLVKLKLENSLQYESGISVKLLPDLLKDLKHVFQAFTGDVLQSIPISTHEDAYLNVRELLMKYGYPVEEHMVQTDDGYLVKLNRIPHGRNGTKNNIVVLLMHGILDSADSWVLQGPGKALAYMLADEGYDVWMGNARGNKYSTSHITLSNKQPEFWKFSWEEIGTYDIPAMIDYILEETQQNNLYYVGHSQGTTSFYVMASMRPEYNKKVKAMFSLSPVAYLSHVKSPIVRLFSPSNKLLETWLSYFNSASSSLSFFNSIMSVICILLPKCDNLVSLLVGYNHENIDKSLLPIVFAHMPCSSSTYQFIHYGQLVQSGKFCRYDFGEEHNMKIYQQPTPPEYEISNITTPIVMFHSENDWLSTPFDVEILKYKLPSVEGVYYIDDLTHIDFMYAGKAKYIVYSNIIRHMQDYENKTDV